MPQSRLKAMHKPEYVERATPKMETTTRPETDERSELNSHLHREGEAGRGRAIPQAAKPPDKTRSRRAV